MILLTNGCCKKHKLLLSQTSHALKRKSIKLYDSWHSFIENINCSVRNTTLHVRGIDDNASFSNIFWTKKK